MEERVPLKLRVPLLLRLAFPWVPVPGNGERVSGGLGERVEEKVPCLGEGEEAGVRERALDLEDEGLAVLLRRGVRVTVAEGEGVGRPLPVALTLGEGPVLGLETPEREVKGEALGGLDKDTVRERMGGGEAVVRALEGEERPDTKGDLLSRGVAVEVAEEEEEGV